MRFFLLSLLFTSLISSTVKAQSLADLATQYADLEKKKDWIAAAPVTEKLVVAAKAEYGDKHFMYFNTLIFAAECYGELKNYSKQVDFLEKLDTMYMLEAQYSDEGLQNLNALCLTNTYAGNYAKSQLYAEKCLKEYTKKYGDHSTDYAICLSNIGNTYMAMGIFSKGLDYMRQAEELVKEVEPDSPQHFSVVNNLAIALTLADFKDEATEQSKLLLNMANRLYADVPLVLAYAHSGLAVNLNMAGRAEEAGPEYEKAAKLFESNGLENGETYGEFLNNYGVYWQEHSELYQAKKCFERSLAIHTALYGAESHKCFYAKVSLGIVKAQLDGNYSGIKMSTQALEQRLLEFKTNQFVLTEQDRIESRQFFDRVFNMLIGELKVASPTTSTFQELNGDLFNLHINSKGMVLGAITKTRNQLLQSSNKGISTKFERWISLKNQLSYYNGLTSESLTASGINVKALATEASSLEKEIFTLAGGLKQEDLKLVRWQDIQKRIGPGEALIEIMRTTYKDSVAYLALILSPECTKGPAMVYLGGEKLEKGEFNYYKNSISLGLKDKLSYDQFWKKISDGLNSIQPNNKRVFVSTEGIYNLISLNTLFDPAKNKYLIDQTSIEYISNSLYLKQKGTATPKSDAWLIGDPDFMAPASGNRTGSTRLVSNLRFNLGKLPGTLNEVNNIKPLLETKYKVNSLVGKSATETAVKNIQSPAILHIATHGYFAPDGQAMMNSGIALSSLNTYYQNPGNYAGDDGLLTAYEIQDMKLEGTNLVVLSACETGLGNHLTGEGIFGLQRAFRLAGASTVITSLWKVDDAATGELMTLFYKSLQSEPNVNKAFSNAQRQLMINYPDPRFWGAFVVVQ